jgi:hypothetical protein
MISILSRRWKRHRSGKPSSLSRDRTRWSKHIGYKKHHSIRKEHQRYGQPDET